MFEVGFTELLLIFALALLVLGPQKLPKLAQQVGRWVGRARAMARQFRDQLEEEAHNLETKMTVDPGIDTSLETRKEPPAATPAPPAAQAHQDVPACQDVEEEFYPPDHHMHPGNRTSEAAAPGTALEASADVPAEAAEPARQGELDLTTDAGPPKTP